MNLQPLKGFRDFLPGEMLERQRVFGVIRGVFERYGFLPMSTPALEYRQLLAGKYGEEGDKLMYSFRDRGERDVAMRYDLTVPLARFIANNKENLPMPFKRYQIDPVWRADKPQKGRYREFYQCDVDVVGTDSLLADAEVIACINETLKELGINDVVIRLNNRKLLDGIMDEAGIEKDKKIPAIRIIDKLDKKDQDEIRGELAGIGVQTAQADKLFEIISQDFQESKDFIARFEEIPGAGELAEVLDILLLMGIKNYQVDLTLARGMDYYTGTIAEFILPDAAQYGSVAGGGRYDKLLGMFNPPQSPLSAQGGSASGGKIRGEERGVMPAVGMSIGIDRLLAALEELELIKYDLVSDVLICNLDENLTEKYLEMASELRKNEIKTDFYYQTDKLDKQLKYADKKNIDFAVILGPDEEKKGVVQVKNMKTGSQESVDIVKIADFLKKKLFS